MKEQDRAEAGTIEAFEDVPLYADDLNQIIKIGTRLGPKIKSELAEFLRANCDVFVWSHVDMCAISLDVISCALNINPKVILVRQKRRMMGLERFVALKEGVDKLLANSFVKEYFYPR